MQHDGHESIFHFCLFSFQCLRKKCVDFFFFWFGKCARGGKLKRGGDGAHHTPAGNVVDFFFSAGGKKRE